MSVKSLEKANQVYVLNIKVRTHKYVLINETSFCNRLRDIAPSFKPASLLFKNRINIVFKHLFSSRSYLYNASEL